MYDLKSKKFCLILYNPSDRDGAVEEADNLQSGLQAVGCQVFKTKWTTKPEIYSLIDDGARRAAEGSLLIVCIMSHGTAGTLRSEDGDGCVLINVLMVRLTRNVPEDLPMVREREKRHNYIPISKENDHCIEHFYQFKTKARRDQIGVVLGCWRAGRRLLMFLFFSCQDMHVLWWTFHDCSQR